MKRLNKITGLIVIVILFSCKNEKETITDAQKIIDTSIEVSGGELYGSKSITFDFRGKHYRLSFEDDKKMMQRSFVEDSVSINDVKTQKFERFVNGESMVVSDSMAVKYSNSINSVFYFALLPYGLNDSAVNKKYLNDVKIGGKEYYKIQVTFNKENGGKDFEDIYIYWFNKETFKPDYLAYKFFDDGGGIRFRVAYNERIVNGIRFVDYKNYSPALSDIDFYKIDESYEKDELKLLSTIELKNIIVNQR